MQFCYPGPMPQPRLGKRCIRCLIRVCRDHMGHQPAELFLFFDREASHKACELACECVIEILDQRGSTCGQPELLLPSIRRILPSTDISMAHQPINRSAGSGLGDRKSVGHVRNGERSLIQLTQHLAFRHGEINLEQVLKHRNHTCLPEDIAPIRKQFAQRERFQFFQRLSAQVRCLLIGICHKVSSLQ